MKSRHFMPRSYKHLGATTNGRSDHMRRLPAFPETNLRSPGGVQSIKSWLLTQQVDSIMLFQSPPPGGAGYRVLASLQLAATIASALPSRIGGRGPSSGRPFGRQEIGPEHDECKPFPSTSNRSRSFAGSLRKAKPRHQNIEQSHDAPRKCARCRRGRSFGSAMRNAMI